MAYDKLVDSTVLETGLTDIANAIRSKCGTTSKLVFPDQYVSAINAISFGTELNFEVVGGTTQPSNPKENTIWIETGYSIHSWDFSATEPNRRSKNKNLLVYPFKETTKTANGITFTDNEDGSITVNGTASYDVNFYLSNNGVSNGEILLEPGTYTLSEDQKITDTNVTLNFFYSYDNWATYERVLLAGTWSRTFTLTKPAKANCRIWVRNGTAVSNKEIRPQLEKGSSATSFIKGDATGQVWIKTSETSPAAFNAIKKNNIMVYPSSCYLYQQGAWKKKPAQSYIGGEWKSWVQYLYNLGDENTALTGGWMTQAVGRGPGGAPDYNQQAEKPVLTTNSDGSVYLYMDYGCGIYRTVNKIKLDGFSTITFNGTLKARVGNDWTGIYVWSAIGQYYVNNVAAKYSLPAQTTLTGDTTLDVSELTGEFYIGLALHENTVNSDSGYIVMNSLCLS